MGRWRRGRVLRTFCCARNKSRDSCGGVNEHDMITIVYKATLTRRVLEWIGYRGPFRLTHTNV